MRALHQGLCDSGRGTVSAMSKETDDGVPSVEKALAEQEAREKDEAKAAEKREKAERGEDK